MEGTVGLLLSMVSGKVGSVRALEGAGAGVERVSRDGLGGGPVRADPRQLRIEAGLPRLRRGRDRVR